MSEVKNNENSQCRRSFENKEDFMKYYNEHKEELDKLTTQQLNSAYVINSCKITKIKNKIIVRTLTNGTSSNSPKNKDKDKEVKTNDKKQKSNKKIKPKDITKILDSLINQYEKQLTTLKEMKNKIISDELYDSEHDE